MYAKRTMSILESCNEIDDMKVLVFGGHGWIGKQVCELLQKCGINHEVSNARGDSIKEVTDNILESSPTHILCAIGRTHGDGFNSIDYLEQPGKLTENLRDNLVGPVQLAIIAAQYDIHFTYLGTGCIYDRPDPCEYQYTEEDNPDFFGSSYSIVKGYTDMLLKNFSNVLSLRIRMPITDTNHPRNFITKLVGYKKICSEYNSVTVLPVMLPIMIDMMKRRITGTYNFTNPGYISHDDILAMYTNIVNPDHSWENVCTEQHNTVLKAKRSNNTLSTQKLEALYPGVPDIHAAVKTCLVRLRDGE